MAAVDQPAAPRMQPPKGLGAEPDHAPSLRPELHIVATNVPIDADLLSAMPPDQRDLWRELGEQVRFFLSAITLQDVVDGRTLGRAVPVPAAGSNRPPGEEEED